MSVRSFLHRNKRYSIIIFCFVFLIAISFLSKDSLTTREFIAAVASSLITAIGWIFSIRLNHLTFQRSEIIKNKDKIVYLIDDFFMEVHSMFEKRETTEQDIDQFVQDKISEIESKAKQIKRIFNENIVFINDEFLVKLKNEPVDIFNGDNKEAKEKLDFLKKSVLDNIDFLYEEWLKTI